MFIVNYVTLFFVLLHERLIKYLFYHRCKIVGWFKHILLYNKTLKCQLHPHFGDKRKRKYKYLAKIISDCLLALYYKKHNFRRYPSAVTLTQLIVINHLPEYNDKLLNIYYDTYDTSLNTRQLTQIAY